MALQSGMRARLLDRAGRPAAPTTTVADRIPAGWRLALLAAGAAVLLTRGWARIAHPTLWAEDGQVFLAAAYQHPLQSVLEPYRGYLHVLPRLLASLAGPLPLTWLPTAYALGAVGTVLAIDAVVLSDRMRWLLPRRWQPPLAFALLVLLPAAEEPYANLANLIFHAGLALLLLALCEDPGRRGARWAELAALAVLGLSGPFALLVLPAFAARWWRLRSGHSARALAVVAAAGVLQWAILLTTPRADTPHLAAADLPRFVGRNVVGTWLFGDRWAPPWTVANTAAVLVWLAAFAVVTWRWAALGPLLSVLAAIGGALLAWGFFLVHPYSGQRHVLVPLAMIAVLLVAGLADRADRTGQADEADGTDRTGQADGADRTDRTDRAGWAGWAGWRRVLAAGCLLAGLGGIVRDAAIRPVPFRPIGPLADCLSAGQPRCSVQVNPPGARWRVTLEPRR